MSFEWLSTEKRGPFFKNVQNFTNLLAPATLCFSWPKARASGLILPKLWAPVFSYSRGFSGGRESYRKVVYIGGGGV
jgi:hypothetical protein